MRAQINSNIYSELSNNTIIALGECNGDNTFEVLCEISEDILQNMSNYEAKIINNKITEINEKD